MKIEDQVCSLELAKSLRKFDVKQESIFWWCKAYLNSKNPSIWKICLRDEDFFYSPRLDNDIFSAFTVSELGEMLPKIITIETDDDVKKIFSNFRFVEGKNTIVKENIPIEVWSVNYICDTTGELKNWLFDTLLTPAIYDKNEANARAKMLIYLIKNGFIKHE